MNEEKQLPIAVPSGALTTLVSSSLLDRGLAGLRRNAEDDEAEKLYQRAMALCPDVDFIMISDISTPLLNSTDWKWHPALHLFTQAAGLDHRDSKFCLGAIHAHSDPLTAVNWYRKAADQSHPEAAFQFVKYLYLDPPEQRSSFATPISLEKACELLEVAAREKHVQAASALGFILLKQAEDSESQDRESILIRASIWFRQAAEAGEADAAFQYAELLSLDDGVFVDFAEAAHWYAIAVDKGHRKAMVELAYLYERGQGVPTDKTAAAALYKRAGALAKDSCDWDDAINFLNLANGLGDSESNDLLIELYMQAGQIALSEKKNDAAKKWFIEASNLGSVEATYQVGCAIFKRVAIFGGVSRCKTLVEEALTYWEAAAQKGHTLAAYSLATHHADINEELAEKWYVNAAVGGHVDAQYRQGKNSAMDGNLNEAIHWCRKAAEQGHVEAAFRLARLLRMERDGIPVDEAEAAKWMIFAADHGHKDAFFYAGWMLHEGFGVQRDDAKSVAYYRMAEENDVGAAINNLGFMYEKGFGVERDYSIAFEFYERAVELGHSFSKPNLARCYKDGRGVEADPDAALYWMMEAAEEDGEPGAQYSLGLWYQQGELVEQNDEIALLWFEKAAKQGHESANNYAGWMHNNGKGCEIDLAKACEYYRFSADKGLAISQCNLAMMYEKGRGVDKDTDEAIRWYRLAARQMYQKAIDALTRLGVDIHGPVARPIAPKISIEVEDRVRKALENVLSKDSAKLTQNK